MVELECTFKLRGEIVELTSISFQVYLQRLLKKVWCRILRFGEC